LIPDVVTGIFH